MNTGQINNFRFTKNSNGSMKIWGEIYNLDTQETIEFNGIVKDKILVPQIEDEDECAINKAVNGLVNNEFEFI